MVRYYALALTTKYWKPGEEYLHEIIEAIASRVDNGDFLVVSEKALSTALNSIMDESQIRPSVNAELISRVWMRVCWGHFIGVLCRFGQRLLRRLRKYPLKPEVDTSN